MPAEFSDRPVRTSERRVNRFFICAGLFLMFGSPLLAGRKTGGNLEIRQDASGISGNVGLTTPGGFRMNQTVGDSSSGNVLRSPSGYEISPGLWGGIAFQPSGVANRLLFGDPRHPVQLLVPPDAIPTDWVVFISTSPASKPLAVSPAVVQQANESLAKTLTRFTKPLDDQLWEIVVLDQNGNRYSSPLQVRATLTLPFRDEEHDGIVDGASPPVRVSSLSVWWLDETHNLWVKLPDSRVDASQNSVSAPISHFSVFTVMGVPSFNPGDSYAFPVPWRPSGPNAGSGSGQTGTATGGITFTNLPSIAKIRIYTLAGNLVREIDHSDGTAQRTWDVRNDAGEEVQTGTYIYVIESGGSRKTGKLVVVR